MQPKKYLKTRTAKYFMDLYNRATLRETIEIAAYKERGMMINGVDDYYPLPINVESIAKFRKINISEPLSCDSNKDAFFMRTGGEFQLKIKPGASIARDRLTIAHEIGHTLFFKNTHHQISVISREEIEAEDYICKRFASALLMPPENIRHYINKIENGTPWEVLLSFERAARTFKVSMPAFIFRIGNVPSMLKFSFIALCLKYFANKYTKSDPCLRVEICSALGDLRNTRTWYNRSAKGLNLLSAENLFNNWIKNLNKKGEVSGGRYTLNLMGDVVRATSKSMIWKKEKLNVSILTEGKWHEEVLPMLAMNCLYAKHGWQADKAYVVSIIKVE